MIKAAHTGFHRNVWNSSHMTQKLTLLDLFLGISTFGHIDPQFI